MKQLLLNKIVWIPSGALFLIWMASLFLCSPDTRVGLDEFDGVWKTTAENYDDRFFEISDSTITFGTGDATQDIYFIHAVTKSAEDQGTVYTISYDNIEGTKFKISFYYQPSHGGVIYFKNQKDVKWTRLNSMQSKKLSDMNASKKH